MDKRFLKEDGSMDIGLINNLPIEEHMDVVGSMTQSEYRNYLDCISKIPIDENQGPVRMIYVDYDMDDERNGVEAHALIKELEARNNLRKKNKETR